MTDAAGVTSFPSLNNAGDDVVLKDSNGNEIDKLTYTDDWYQDLIKKSGGYSLELINPNDPCSDASNWIASTSSSGGTPGFQNSVYYQYLFFRCLNAVNTHSSSTMKAIIFKP
jgi:hypothetical protein